VRRSRVEARSDRSLVAVTIALVLLAAPFASAQTRPRIVDGKYENPEGYPGAPKMSAGLLWFLVRDYFEEFGSRERRVPEVADKQDQFLRDNAGSGVATVTWIGHATLLVQMGEVTFLTDPVWADCLPTARRLVKPGLEIDELPPIDFVLVSHNHGDHMEDETLARLGRGATRILVPLGNRKTLDEAVAANVDELGWWDSITIRNVTIHSVPTRHYSQRGLTDRNDALWSGWYVIAPDRRFYFSGDSGDHPWFGEIRDTLGAPDLAAVGIGAYAPRHLLSNQHMTPEDAMDAVTELDARHSVAMHYGTFDLADEDLHEPPERFRAASAARGRTAEDDWVLKIGETRRW
jgi:N-acyl-phosphatidylethanolamine-hydrolysing phospholipase D